MSGVYSEGVAHTCGQYGSVALKHFFGVLRGPQRGLRLSFYFLQLYSLTRVGILLGIIISIIGFDSTRQMNCQVIPVSHICLVSYTAP